MRPIFTLALIGLTACAARVRHAPIDFADDNCTGEQSLESTNVEGAAEAMVSDMQASAALKEFDGTPRIAVLPVENRSGCLLDENEFTTRITEALVRESGGYVAAVSLSPADFDLAGALVRLPSQSGSWESRRPVVRFKLIDAEGLIVWTRTYELRNDQEWAGL